MKKPGSRPVPKTQRAFKLVPYDNAWLQIFASKAMQLKQIFGPIAISIEHIGSTAIPDMWAKPQIDILIVVKDLNEVKAYYQQMQQAGFTPRGDYTGEGEEYFSEDSTDGTRLTSIHIMPKGHAWAKELILFRDYLRTHPRERDYYSRAKQALAKKYKDDYTAYFLHKRDVVHRLRDKAEAWKKNQP